MAIKPTIEEADYDRGIPLVSIQLSGPIAEASDDIREPDEADRGQAIPLADNRLNPLYCRPIPTGQTTILDRAGQEEATRYEELLDALVGKPTIGSRWLHSRGAIWAIVLIGAMLSLFVLAQAASFVAEVEALPAVWRAVGYAAAGILVTSFAIAGVRLVVLYASLRRSPVFHTGALQELASRQRLRSLYVRRAFEYVFRSLHPLLVEYPLDDRASARLRRWGANETQVEHLRKARASLLPASMSAEYWIEGFRTRFLRVVDEVAANRIRQAALAAGKLTAISPRGTIDAIVTGSLALELIGDLCTIYNLKANRFETLRILGLVFASAGIANEADEWSQSTAESMFDSLSTEWLPGILGAVGARVAGAAADGVLNAAMIWRIGRRTIRAVRPLN